MEIIMYTDRLIDFEIVAVIVGFFFKLFLPEVEKKFAASQQKPYLKWYITS